MHNVQRNVTHSFFIVHWCVLRNNSQLLGCIPCCKGNICREPIRGEDQFSLPYHNVCVHSNWAAAATSLAAHPQVGCTYCSVAPCPVHFWPGRGSTRGEVSCHGGGGGSQCIETFGCHLSLHFKSKGSIFKCYVTLGGGQVWWVDWGHMTLQSEAKATECSTIYSNWVKGWSSSGVFTWRRHDAAQILSVCLLISSFIASSFTRVIPVLALSMFVVRGQNRFVYVIARQNREQIVVCRHWILVWQQGRHCQTSSTPSK